MSEHDTYPRTLVAERRPRVAGALLAQDETACQSPHMVLSLAAVLLVAALQSASADRSQAEDLARAGRNAEALALFERIAASDPSDIDARLWVARLAMRLGRTAEAQAAFRSVLQEHPSDVEARIGLGAALTRAGDWRGALTVLQQTERDAGQNADFFSAIGRAYRRAGDDQRALESFERAHALAPDDRDITVGYESAMRSYGHWIGVEGFGQTTGPDTGVGSGSVAGDLRVTPRLHLEGSARVQQGPGYSDATAGGGFVWRLTGDTTVSFHARGGSGNVALPANDLSGDVVHYASAIEFGGAIRRLSFDSADIVAASPLFAWHPNDQWRTEARYTYSRSSFHSTGQSTGDHSGLVRETWQHWRRVALLGSYAYGIESFEDLTADRLSAIGASTVAVGLRADLRTMTRIAGTWEHQWRSNGTTLDRATVSVSQFFR